MEWKIYNLVRQESTGVVGQVYCKVILSESGHTVVNDISQKVPYKDPSDPLFIPFEQLTEAETVQWIKDQLGPQRVSAIERGLTKALEREKVKMAEGVPW